MLVAMRAVVATGGIGRIEDAGAVEEGGFEGGGVIDAMSEFGVVDEVGVVADEGAAVGGAAEGGLAPVAAGIFPGLVGEWDDLYRKRGGVCRVCDASAFDGDDDGLLEFWATISRERMRRPAL